jgi:deoxyribonuclease V
MWPHGEHSNVTTQEARALQDELRNQVRITPLKNPPQLVGGCDISMNRFAKVGFGGFVVLQYPTLAPRTECAVQGDIPFPYIPGLLSFRELPLLVTAWKQLPIKPHVLFVDGVGIAHPRRIGIASHLGIVLDIPTIGCAKSVLTGTYDEPDDEPGSASFLYDHNEVIGAALRTKRRAAPMFISPGHKLTLDDALMLTTACVRNHRIPEPTRLAHLLVNRHREADLQSSIV